MAKHMGSNYSWIATPVISTHMARPESVTSHLSSSSPTKLAPSTGQRTTMIPSLACHPSCLATSTPVPNTGSPLGLPLMSTILLMKSTSVWAMQTRVAMREHLAWMATLICVSGYSPSVTVWSRDPYLGTTVYRSHSHQPVIILHSLIVKIQQTISNIWAATL